MGNIHRYTQVTWYGACAVAASALSVVALCRRHDS